LYLWFLPRTPFWLVYGWFPFTHSWILPTHYTHTRTQFTVATTHTRHVLTLLTHTTHVVEHLFVVGYGLFGSWVIVVSSLVVYTLPVVVVIAVICSSRVTVAVSIPHHGYGSLFTVGCFFFCGSQHRPHHTCSSIYFGLDSWLYSLHCCCYCITVSSIGSVHCYYCTPVFAIPYLPPVAYHLWIPGYTVPILLLFTV